MFIFRLRKSPLQQFSDRMHAFVLWYTPISPPQPHIKLRVVEKVMSSLGHLGGIVPLDCVKLPCAFAPMLDEAFWDQVELHGDAPQITEQNCMSHFDKFFLNCFAGHVDYEVLR